MLKGTGIVFILLSSVLLGRSLSCGIDSSLVLNETFLSFVMYINTSIKTARTPLQTIFSSFTDECGFADAVRGKGLEKAIDERKSEMTAETYEAMTYLAQNLGGIDANSQFEICEYTEKRLRKEIEKLKKDLSEKKRMYRMLPILAGLSAIILIL